ncbi:hypothetical protein T484DRAFT_1915691 [Baffinella frigidus]|nr:hypothetical protein T484DRAFT_1915691 [Cryptophyta sp. CCMP2293]
MLYASVPGGVRGGPASAAAGAGSFGKVYWYGRHSVFKDASGQRMGAPLGKIHKEGIRELERAGWTKVDVSTPLMPVFALTSRQGGDFPMDQEEVDDAGGARWPLVRQLPQALTALLDDKRELHLTLLAAGSAHIAPETIVDMSEVLDESWAGLADPEALWFVKHRRGVKGQAVYPLEAANVPSHINRIPPESRADYILQRGIGGQGGAPGCSGAAHLIEGRKWCMRLHVLEVASRDERYPAEARMYLHRDIIALPHSAPLPPSLNAPTSPAVAVTSRDPALAARLWPALASLVADTLHAFRLRSSLLSAAPPGPPGARAEGGAAEVCLEPPRSRAEGGGGGAASPEETASKEVVRPQLYHLFGFDVIIDAAEQVWLLEVNSYPAIHSGTMSSVDADVYTTLIRDILSLLVLPALPKGLAHCDNGGEKRRFDWVSAIK